MCFIYSWEYQKYFMLKYFNYFGGMTVSVVILPFHTMLIITIFFPHFYSLYLRIKQILPYQIHTKNSILHVHGGQFVRHFLLILSTDALLYVYEIINQLPVPCFFNYVTTYSRSLILMCISCDISIHQIKK